MPQKKFSNLITLRELNINSIPDDASILYIGGRNTGKTTNIYNLLFSKCKKIDTAMVISSTSKVNQNFMDIIPKKFIHFEYDKKKVQNLLDRQERIINLRKTDPKYKNCNTKTMFILDDMAYDKTWPKDPNISLMAMNGRHYECLFIVSLQYCLTMKPELRTNFQYIFLHRTTNKHEKKKLYEYFAGMFDNFNTFELIFDDITSNYGCMAINTNSASNNLTDYVFYFNPKKREELSFTMCSTRHWETDGLADVQKTGFRRYQVDPNMVGGGGLINTQGKVQPKME